MLTLPTFAAGLAFGLSLIVALGAQNLFVLRQGVLRHHVPTVVAICTASDALLIAAVVAGAGAALGAHPELLAGVRLAGAFALFSYAGLAARRAWRIAPDTRAADPSRSVTTRAAVITACLAFTWLNPAVYLDTVVLLGSVAAGEHNGRWSFGAGASTASALWFVGLGFGARLLSPWLNSPGGWRALDGFVAVVMATTAARLLLGA